MIRSAVNNKALQKGFIAVPPRGEPCERGALHLAATILSRKAKGSLTAPLVIRALFGRRLFWRQRTLITKAAYTDNTLLRVVVLALYTNNPAAYADAFRYHEIKAATLLVRPYRAYFMPICFLLAAFFWVFYYISGVGRFHGLLSCLG